MTTIILIAAIIAAAIVLGWMWGHYFSETRLAIRYRIERALHWFRKHGHTTFIRSDENPAPRTLLHGKLLTKAQIDSIDDVMKRRAAATQDLVEGKIDNQAMARINMEYHDALKSVGIDWDTKYDY